MPPTIRVQAGKLRKRVVLQTLTVTPKDSFGQSTKTWVDTASYWAEVKPVTARDIIISQQVKSQITHTVRMRYLGSGVSLGPATHQLKLGTRILGIVGVMNADERNHMYELICQEIQV
jgi:SPP1 family predicted phage head-tail adaptor